MTEIRTFVLSDLEGQYVRDHADLQELAVTDPVRPERDRDEG